jgi:hypothetical protein
VESLGGPESKLGRPKVHPRDRGLALEILAKGAEAGVIQHEAPDHTCHKARPTAADGPTERSTFQYRRFDPAASSRCPRCIWERLQLAEADVKRLKKLGKLLG